MGIEFIFQTFPEAEAAEDLTAEIAEMKAGIAREEATQKQWHSKIDAVGEDIAKIFAARSVKDAAQLQKKLRDIHTALQKHRITLANAEESQKDLGDELETQQHENEAESRKLTAVRIVFPGRTSAVDIVGQIEAPHEKADLKKSNHYVGYLRFMKLVLDCQAMGPVA